MCHILYDSRNNPPLDYGDLWGAFYTTDVRDGNKVWDMYSNHTPYLTLGTNQDTGSGGNEEGKYYNREHSFPQSWFGSSTPMYTDLHHIYPTDKCVNGKRSNYPFGTTNGEDYKSNGDFSKLGTCTYPGYNGTVFEPNDIYKGDFARTYFYMVTCYEEQLSSWVSSYGGTTDVDEVLDGNTYPGLTTWQKNMLLEWAAADPVSQKEINRNNAVYTLQGNRNPFIDYPGLEQYIWGSKTDVAFDYDDYDGSGSGTGGDPDPGPNPGTGTYKLTITAADFNGTSYAANNSEKTSYAVCTTDASKTYEVKWTSYQVMLQSGKMQWQTNKGYIYNSTDLGTIESVTVTKTAGTFTTYYGTSEQPSSSTAVGDGYFKTCVGNATGTSSQVEVVFTIADGGDDPGEEPFDGNYFTKITSMGDFEDGGTYLIVYEAGSKAFNGSLDLLDVANNGISVEISDNRIEATSDIMASSFTITAKVEGYSIKSASGYYIGNTSDANSLKRSAEDKYTNSITFGNSDGNVYIQSSSSFLRYNNGASDNRFRYFKSSTYTQQQAIQLYKYIPLPSQTVSVGDTGYATMVAEADLVVPNGVEVFAAQHNAGSAYVHLEPVTGGIPQGEAVVVKASEGTYDFLYATEPVSAIVGNGLKAATSDISADGTQYCLASMTLGIGFYKVQAGVTIRKGKAYLLLSSGNNVKEFYGFEDDDPTGINEELRMKNEESSIYNLAGQRLSKPQRGLNIIGGRKVLR